MNRNQVQEIATKNNLGQVHFEVKDSQILPGRSFEVGYVSVDKNRVLFCKRHPNSNPDQFYLCNEYAKLESEPEPDKVEPQSLFDSADKYTPEANNLCQEAREAVKAVMLAYIHKGYSIREVSHIVQGAVFECECELMM